MDKILKDIKTINGGVVVALEDKNYDHTYKKVGDIILHTPNLDFSPNDFYKRKGKVVSLSIPKYYKGLNNKYMLGNIMVEVGDTVIFDIIAQTYNNELGFNFISENDERLVYMKFYHLICKLDENGITMLNGRVLVKEEKEKTNKIIIPDGAYIHKYAILTVENINNKEDFKGDYEPLIREWIYCDTQRDWLEKGDRIITMGYVNFNLSGVIPETELLDEKTMYVERKNILGKIVGDDVVPFGTQVLIKPVYRDYKTESGIIIPESVKLLPIYGEVLAIGSSVTNCCVGDTVRYAEREGIEYNGKVLIHNNWILMTDIKQ